MGIEKLNVVLKRHSPDAFVTVPIQTLSGKKIAIDSSIWMRANMSTARKIVINRTDLMCNYIENTVIATSESNDKSNEQTQYNFLSCCDPKEITKEWLVLLSDFVAKCVKFNVKPLFVLDGKPPEEKDDVITSRKNKKMQQLLKLEELYKQMKSNHVLIKEFKEKFKNYNYISPENQSTFEIALKEMGMPMLRSTTEAEKLCSMLCRDKKVDAVYSKDTDNLAYGCPLLLTGFSTTYFGNGSEKQPMLEAVRLDKILEGLNLSYPEFVDFCIMCGCDYNTHMPGVASLNAYKLLSRYRSIDNLPDTKNIHLLNHIKCREAFKYVRHEELIEDNFVNLSFEICSSALKSSKKYFDNIELGYQYPSLINAYNSGLQILQAPSSLFDSLKYVESENTELIKNSTAQIPNSTKRLVLNIVRK